MREITETSNNIIQHFFDCGIRLGINDFNFVKDEIQKLRNSDLFRINIEVKRIKIGFDSRVAKKYLKPQSAGYNDCVLKLNSKVNIAQTKIKEILTN